MNNVSMDLIPMLIHYELSHFKHVLNAQIITAFYHEK